MSSMTNEECEDLRKRIEAMEHKVLGPNYKPPTLREGVAKLEEDIRSRTEET